jgi:hypothetical protein
MLSASISYPLRRLMNKPPLTCLLLAELYLEECRQILPPGGSADMLEFAQLQSRGSAPPSFPGFALSKRITLHGRHKNESAQ